MNKKLVLLSGPNLNMLGTRQPEIYGSLTLQDHVDLARATAESHGYSLTDFQTNSEGEMVIAIQKARDSAGVVINPGAFTHYSWAISDALAAVKGPVIELHISNPESRESWRKSSVVAPVASGTIAGFGGDGYRLAIEAIVGICNRQPTT